MFDGCVQLGLAIDFVAKQRQAESVDQWHFQCCKWFGWLSVVREVCAHWGVSADALVKALTMRSVSSGSKKASVYAVPLKSVQAAETRDALSKTLFSRLFNWLVAHINVLISKDAQSNRSIAVLDIFGFEFFETNSFEQAICTCVWTCVWTCAWTCVWTCVCTCV